MEAGMNSILNIMYMMILTISPLQTVMVCSKTKEWDYTIIKM